VLVTPVVGKDGDGTMIMQPFVNQLPPAERGV
jgi:hypothetical protein